MPTTENMNLANAELYDAVKLRDKLNELGVCPDCLQEYIHDLDAPFAACDCKPTIEWSDPIPLLFDLRRKAAVAVQLWDALKHAEDRLNMLPHNYDDTDFRKISDALDAAKKVGLHE